MTEHEDLENPIPLIFFKVYNGEEVELKITVNGEENISVTGDFIGAHRAESLDGEIVWQGNLH